MAERAVCDVHERAVLILGTRGQVNRCGSGQPGHAAVVIDPLENGRLERWGRGAFIAA